MAEEKQSTASKAAHASSPNIKQKDTIYQAEYFGSGTFRIVKPKRKNAKRRQSALKGTTRGSRK
jgi:hypothetical protein